MKRRTLLLSACALWAAPPAGATAQPWSARLLQGGFDGKAWWMGLAITMDHGWKTYWRVPGDGGIAPQLDLSGENLGSHDILYPMPRRYEDEAGMTIGYKEEVVFPIAITPADISKPVRVVLKGFFGVCDTVCIPAQFEGQLSFSASSSAAPDQALISNWLGRVPKVQPTGPVDRAEIRSENGKPLLVLGMSQSVGDVFAEGKPTHYFGKPSFEASHAVLVVSGAKTEDDVRGSMVRLTLDFAGTPLEQVVTVV